MHKKTFEDLVESCLSNNKESARILEDIESIIEELETLYKTNKKFRNIFNLSLTNIEEVELEQLSLMQSINNNFLKQKEELENEILALESELLVEFRTKRQLIFKSNQLLE